MVDEEILKAVRKILCERTNNIDLDRVLAEGLCVTVCTRRGELGALLSKPFGMFYILTMQDAVLRRPGDENTRIPHFFYIDEFPDFVNMLPSYEQTFFLQKKLNNPLFALLTPST